MDDCSLMFEVVCPDEVLILFHYEIKMLLRIKPTYYIVVTGLKWIEVFKWKPELLADEREY